MAPQAAPTIPVPPPAATSTYVSLGTDLHYNNILEDAAFLGTLIGAGVFCIIFLIGITLFMLLYRDPGDALCCAGRKRKRFALEEEGRREKGVLRREGSGDSGAWGRLSGSESGGITEPNSPRVVSFVRESKEPRVGAGSARSSRFSL
ncbi:hypothetical protein M501DRAFT_1012695 [Patellaria atrata CBS 101060]|uniref:Uncharacterized protein n=1 Tax=Patellaria atrata CBS 101060 TaxID=1346257 RepID=A0A9P4SIV2_9PEZI|nr:hypothetical protein M501DRAFT_1012695 [Patellaria atrata CBS 101060]